MRTLEDSLNERLKDSNFLKEYENIKPEMNIIRTLVEARKDKNITQKELSAKTGINQADISKLETGTKNPTLNMLKKLADGLDMKLKIDFVAKDT